MCEPATIAMSVAAVAGGALLASSMSPKTPNVSPTAPTPPPAPPTPEQEEKQAARTPDVEQLRAKNSGNRIDTGPGASSGSTLLTGPDGIDSDSLPLKKNTLLGG